MLGGPVTVSVLLTLSLQTNENLNLSCKALDYIELNNGRPREDGCSMLQYFDNISVKLPDSSRTSLQYKFLPK